MKIPFKFIVALVATAGILSPAVSKAQDNTYYGTGALHSGTTTGEDDSAFGFDALYHNTTGAYNTATGVNALFANTTGAFNTAAGQGALTANTKGNYNVANGFQALYLNTTGYQNTANGYQALSLNTTGAQNTASGWLALRSNSTADANTAFGFETLSSNTTGIFNTAIGYQALALITTGARNIAVGQFAGLNLTTGSNNIDIGDVSEDGAAEDTAKESDTIRIGEVSTQTATYIAGISGANVGSTAQYVVISGSGQLGTAAGTITSISPLKMNAALAKLEERNTRLEATVAEQATTMARQQQDLQSAVSQITILTSSLKVQASLLQKVSAQMEMNRAAPQMVSNN